MITQEDINRFEQMQEATPKKLVVIDTMQYFEIEIPTEIHSQEFVESKECRKICADKILSQMTDLNLHQVLDVYDPKTETWS